MLLSRLLGDAVVAGHTEVALLITTRAFGNNPLRLNSKQSTVQFSVQLPFLILYYTINGRVCLPHLWLMYQFVSGLVSHVLSSTLSTYT